MLSNIKFKEIKSFIKAEVYPYLPTDDELWNGIKTSIAYINSFYNSLQAEVYKEVNKVTYFQTGGGSTTVINNNYVKHIRPFEYDIKPMILESCEFATSNDPNVSLDILVANPLMVNTVVPSLGRGYCSLAGVNLFVSFKVDAGIEVSWDTLNIQTVMTYYRYASIPQGMNEVPDDDFADIPPTDLLWLVLLSAQRVKPATDINLINKIKEIENDKCRHLA